MSSAKQIKRKLKVLNLNYFAPFCSKKRATLSIKQEQIYVIAGTIFCTSLKITKSDEHSKMKELEKMLQAT